MLRRIIEVYRFFVRGGLHGCRLVRFHGFNLSVHRSRDYHRFARDKFEGRQFLDQKLRVEGQIHFEKFHDHSSLRFFDNHIFTRLYLDNSRKVRLPLNRYISLLFLQKLHILRQYGNSSHFEATRLF